MSARRAAAASRPVSLQCVCSQHDQPYMWRRPVIRTTPSLSHLPASIPGPIFSCSVLGVCQLVECDSSLGEKGRKNADGIRRRRRRRRCAVRLCTINQSHPGDPELTI
ncbi:unnamed protein product [Danaus chrysippus]|uniref:(African queen) hypothetical protein n=1 Tax=Danaus chrysippus TaxID=151541 RepID=A0A8J2QNZ0_9NEOP|nr:unnamed protein product [Danaus chrysippus]